MLQHFKCSNRIFRLMFFSYRVDTRGKKEKKRLSNLTFWRCCHMIFDSRRRMSGWWVAPSVTWRPHLCTAPGRFAPGANFRPSCMCIAAPGCETASSVWTAAFVCPLWFSVARREKEKKSEIKQTNIVFYFYFYLFTKK